MMKCIIVIKTNALLPTNDERRTLGTIDSLRRCWCWCHSFFPRLCKLRLILDFFSLLFFSCLRSPLSLFRSNSTYAPKIWVYGEMRHGKNPLRFEHAHERREGEVDRDTKSRNYYYHTWKFVCFVLVRAGRLLHAAAADVRRPQRLKLIICFRFSDKLCEKTHACARLSP